MTTTKRASRPAKSESRVETTNRTARQRIPVGKAHRDILTLNGKDPDFMYRWVHDVHENGQRILRFIDGGWEHVKSEDVSVGDNMVFKSDNVGSIVRVPTLDGSTYMYAMRIPKEYYEEDQMAKLSYVDELEAQTKKKLRPDEGNENGQYGSVEIK